MPIKKITNCFALLLLLATIGCQKDVASPASSSAIAAVDSSKIPPVQPAAKVEKQYSGPFGLAGGISTSELIRLGLKASDSNPEVFTGKPPKPLEGFSDYFVLAMPEIGVCKIRADHNIGLVNGSGDQLKAKTDQIAETVATKYGKHSTKVDYISKDVYKRNPEFWMMGLKEESVYYAYDWSTGKTQQPLPDDVANIEVGATAISGSSGYVSIRYTYKNFEKCKSAMRKQQANSL